jgi:hypothetical protein
MRKSYRFVDEDWKVKAATRRCDDPGCLGAGEFRAPKNRDHLDEYYWFCQGHVREYNVEAHHRSDSTWQRPTWPLGQQKFTKLVENSMHYHPLTGCFPGENLHTQVNDPNAKWFAHHTEECKALVFLGLDQPVTFQVVREAYKSKVKQFHPDANKGCKLAEERLKTINVAYGLLKKSF